MEYLHIVFARLYAILNLHKCKYNSIDTELDKRYESLDDITLAQFHKHVKKYTSLPISSDMCTDELQCVLIDAHNKFFNLLCLLSVNMLNLDEYNHCVLQAVQADPQPGLMTLPQLSHEHVSGFGIMRRFVQPGHRHSPATVEACSMSTQLACHSCKQSEHSRCAESRSIAREQVWHAGLADVAGKLRPALSCRSRAMAWKDC